MDFELILSWTVTILKGPILFALIFLLMVCTATFIYNTFEQRKALSLMKDPKNHVGRVGFKEWASFIGRRKNYSVYPYLLVAVLVGVSIYSVSYLLLTVAFSFFLWKQLSLYWPCTFVFSEEGIYFWDPFIMSVRKNFPDKVLWEEVIDVNYAHDTKEVVIRTQFETLYYPVNEQVASELLVWLKGNYLNQVVSYEYEKSTSLV